MHDSNHKNELEIKTAQIMLEQSIVCKCKGVKYKTIKKAITEQKAKNIDDIRRLTNANTGCGKACTNKIIEMLEKYNVS